jgi:protein SCO1/2
MNAAPPRQRELFDWRFFVAAFVIGAVSLTAIRPLLKRSPPPPPVLGEVPSFRLVDSDGHPFGSADLAGQAYVVNFFFTRCPSICPAQMQSMKELAELYRSRGIRGVTLLSISVDPEHDTPEVLRDYGAKLGASAPGWHLLTGGRAEIVALAEHGLKVGVGETPTAGADLTDIGHTGKFVLVDPAGRLRGYYERSDTWGMDELFERSRQVLGESPR